MASLFGRMVELAECENEVYSDECIEPIIVTNDNVNKKITIDLNINIHVFNHKTKSTED